MAGSIRLFVHDRLFAGAVLASSPEQSHYLATVMRCGPGSPVRLFNGQDGEWESRVASLRRDRATLEVEALLRAQPAEPDLWLAFAMLKRHATELVVQKATELGASALLPVRTERTVSDRINPGRLTAIATEAAEQCERLSVPALQALQSLSALLAAWPAERCLFAAVERENAPFLPPAGDAPAALLTGPEGGLTAAELDVLRSRPFVVLVTLGARILRAETAAIAGLALLQAPVSR
jgi:16S rRNA (uracil1498-N3)-methyltransferase